MKQVVDHPRSDSTFSRLRRWQGMSLSRTVCNNVTRTLVKLDP